MENQVKKEKKMGMTKYCVAVFFFLLFSLVFLHARFYIYKRKA